MKHLGQVFRFFERPSIFLYPRRLADNSQLESGVFDGGGTDSADVNIFTLKIAESMQQVLCFLFYIKLKRALASHFQNLTTYLGDLTTCGKALAIRLYPAIIKAVKTLQL
ncbi:hypothetical protein ACVRXQ_04470 [Streptococcus panodentis]|uniref:Uncharacterized protein n=1 Tax=Streptococcus panodentis TaxID=1581472 RepID=A0ABS5AZP7_9STRE|nr:hypothetical protein [Streptococcus panodentis]MBP2621184.1 hypothetical protein [Streptococcus panodentis]